MSKDEFQTKYHAYITHDMQEAKQEAEKINREADGFTVEPQEFKGTGICLMLSTARAFIAELCPDLFDE